MAALKIGQASGIVLWLHSRSKAPMSICTKVLIADGEVRVRREAGAANGPATGDNARSCRRKLC